MCVKFLNRLLALLSSIDEIIGLRIVTQGIVLDPTKAFAPLLIAKYYGNFNLTYVQTF
jgi:L-lysine 2,3-aminomutase